MRRQKLQKPHFRNRIYSLSALLYRHLGFIMLAPPALGMRQQSSIPISMVHTVPDKYLSGTSTLSWQVKLARIRVVKNLSGYGSAV